MNTGGFWLGSCSFLLWSSQSAVNIYDLPGYDLQQGVELRGRLGEGLSAEKH